MSIVNSHSVVIAKVKTAAGNTRYVARMLSKVTRLGTKATVAYTFSPIPFMTRDEAIMDLEQRMEDGARSFEYLRAAKEG
jgi:hypothetical protein